MIEVVYWCTQRDALLVKSIDYQLGMTVHDALLLAQAPAFAAVGIWGQQVPLDHPVVIGDRVEGYQTLLQDAKTGRIRRVNEAKA